MAVELVTHLVKRSGVVAAAPLTHNRGRRLRLPYIAARFVSRVLRLYSVSFDTPLSRDLTGQRLKQRVLGERP